MNDLLTLPSRLPAIKTQQGPIALERPNSQHAEMLAEAGKASAPSVHPWLGKALCPVSLRNALATLSLLEEQRKQGFGIAYLMKFEQRCLGMAWINYIHPTHQTASLGYWLHPDARGQGLAQALCEAMRRLAFQQMGLIRLELFIEPGNHASIALATRLRANKEGLCKKRILGKDAWLYSLT